MSKTNTQTHYKHTPSTQTHKTEAQKHITSTQTHKTEAQKHTDRRTEAHYKYTNTQHTQHINTNT